MTPNTIDLNYQNTDKKSWRYRMMAFILAALFITIPMYEFLEQFAPISLGMCCTCDTF